MRVKICGVCSEGDARLATEAGADYVGVILSPHGPRHQPVTAAMAIFEAAEGASRVGVFVDAPIGQLVSAAHALSLDVIQLHGGEDEGAVAAVRRAGPWRIWKSVRFESGDDFTRALDRWQAHVDGLLLEGWSARGHGGVSASFDWLAASALRDRVPSGLELIVAGGLDPDNVALAVGALAPDTVDVSSGVESVLCRKSPGRVRAFVAAARAAVPPLPA